MGILLILLKGLVTDVMDTAVVKGVELGRGGDEVVRSGGGVIGGGKGMWK